MNINNKKLLITALILALVATTLVYFYLDKIKEENQRIEPTEMIVIAKMTIEPRTTITTDMVELREVKTSSIKQSAVRSVDDVIGKIAKERIYSEEPVIPERLADSIYQKEHLAYSIPKGYRAIALQYDPVMGVGGFIQPGDYVDVVGNYDSTHNPTNEDASRIILQNILVLAVGETTDVNIAKEKGETGTITLAVKQAQAEKLTFSQEFASVRLLLRPINENAVQSTSGTTKHNIYTP